MITILIAHIRGGLSFPGTENGKYREDDPRFLLLREGLRKMGMSLQADSLTPDGIDRTDDGKPYFKEIPGIRFNLSHSGDYIACAFSDREIGLDLQICSAPHLSVMRIAKRFFTGQEYEALYTLPPAQDSPRPDNSAPRLDLFYNLWSVKEACLKYIGCGLRGGMDSFLPDPMPITVFDPADETNILFRGRIMPNGGSIIEPAEFALIRAPQGYTMAVCAEKIPEKVMIETLI